MQPMQGTLQGKQPHSILYSLNKNIMAEKMRTDNRIQIYGCDTNSISVVKKIKIGNPFHQVNKIKCASNYITIICCSEM